MTDTKKTFMDKPIRTAYSAEHGGWLFSAMDICAVLTDTNRPRGYWNDKKKEIQVSEKIVHLKMLAPSGRMHPTDALNIEGATLLARSIKSPLIEKFIDWLAQFSATQKSNRNYILKHKDTKVAEIQLDENGAITTIHKIHSERHLPIGTVVRGKFDDKELKDWWISRSIPASREGIKNFLENLGLTLTQQLLDKSMGLSLSDQYWICPALEEIEWAKVNFFHNDFSDDVGDMLFGRGVRDKNAVSLVSPDNTSDGVLKKKWKIIDGKRCLIKGGTRPLNQEVANEVLAARICERLGIPFVDYWITEIDGVKYSVCEDFITGDTELVHAWRIDKLAAKNNNTSHYEAWVSLVESFGIKDVRLKIGMMLVLDFILVNPDRHYNNFGLIRNANTLEWIGVAPIYDSGTSMWCHKGLNQIYADGATKDIKPFRTTHEGQIKFVEDFSWLNLDALDGIENEYLKMLKASTDDPTEFESRYKKLCLALRRRIEILREFVAKKKTNIGSGE